MPKVKYIYNTKTCQYDRVKRTAKGVILDFGKMLLLATFIGLGIFFFVDNNFESPVKTKLKAENQELKYYYDVMKKDVEETEKMLGVLQEKDDNIYRVVFGVDPISQEVRKAGRGGVEKYKNFTNRDIESDALILENLKKIDKLKKQMYIQTKSYDEIIDLAKDKESLMASIPAIQPVTNKELKRLASGYGYRIDPFLKIKKMHSGTDFSVNVGTKVYATGNGKVRLVHSSFGGYGKQIEINHGFGYRTKYAHLSKILVKKGQKVTRGELIGLSGSTGRSTAPHLHYEVKKDGKTVNPVNYFYKDLTDNQYQEILRLSAIENQSMGALID